MDTPVEEPRHLRTLRRLVNTLTVVLILGFITVVVVIVIRFAAPAAPVLQLPDNIELPAGRTAQAVTLGTDFVAIVTMQSDGREEIYIYNLDGTLRQNVSIKVAQ